MKLTLLAIICITLAFGAVYAQPVPVSQMPELPKIDTNGTGKAVNIGELLNRLQRQFGTITSFRYAVHGGKPDDRIFEAFSWKEAADSYYYDVSSINHVKHTEVHKIFAYDGKQTMELRADNVIEVKHGESPLRIPLAFPSPLDLYLFLSTDGNFISMDKLRSNPQMWKDLSLRVSCLGTQKFGDQDCFVLRFFGSFSRVLKEKASYDVYLDSHSLIPIGWQAYDQQGILIEQMEGLDFKTIIGSATASPFTYPSHCRVTQYQWPGVITGPEGVVKYYKSVRDEYFNDVQINCLSASDVQIDPSMATAIIDDDSGVAIPIPR